MGGQLSKGDIARVKILESAIKLFSTHGVDSTSIEMIAKDCKLSSTAPLYYFYSKEGLLEHVLFLITEHNQQFVQSVMDPKDNAAVRLEKYFKQSLAWSIQHRDHAQILLYVCYLSTFNNDFTARYSKILSDMKAKIQEMIFAGQREGLFTLSGTTSTVAEILADLLHAGIINVVASGNAGNNLSKSVHLKWHIAFKQLLGLKNSAASEAAERLSDFRVRPMEL